MGCAKNEAVGLHVVQTVCVLSPLPTRTHLRISISTSPTHTRNKTYDPGPCSIPKPGTRSIMLSFQFLLSCVCAIHVLPATKA